MDKLAYEMGVRAALHDLGIVGGAEKTAAGEMGMLGKALGELPTNRLSGALLRGRGMAQEGIAGLKGLGQRGVQAMGNLTPAQQYALMAGGGGAVGAGAGALGSEDTGMGALLGGLAGAGLGAGGVGAYRGVQGLRGAGSVQRFLRALAEKERAFGPESYIKA